MNLPPTSNSASSTPSEALAPQRKAAEQAALDAQMALLPDYGDEAFPHRPKRSPGWARKSEAAKVERVTAQMTRREGSKPRGIGPHVAGEGAEDVAAPGSVVAVGCLGGMLGHVALGFVLLAGQRAGIALYGPGVLAVVVALVALALLAGTWPRRVWLATGGFLLGLVLCFGALFLFVRPALDPASARWIPAATSPGGVPPPAETGDGMQPS